VRNISWLFLKILYFQYETVIAPIPQNLLIIYSFRDIHRHIKKMKRKDFFIRIVSVIFIMGMVAFGCDFSKKEEIPPEKLPPVPESCATLSNQYSHALMLAHSSAEVSQLQITRIASQFAQCMEDAGLSEAEAKGIVKNMEKTVREEGEKGGGQEGDLYR
jgi:hypothetical protein